MRLPSFALALFFGLSAITTQALAAGFETPEALLKALYSNQGKSTDGPTPYAPYFSDHLNGLFQDDLKKTQPGDVGAIDFDPVIAGQDGKATHVKIGKPDVDGDNAKVVVNFENGGPVTLYYTLVREHGGWKVDDIADKAGDNSWSLGDIFANAQY
ncbi:DUF3828 domain-containing protein [Neorhizobium sp. P12A]|jgi:hypothetical protein|uniref:DUF3828 domain-containing protein n=1 Tax=Rhizobium/Agrobacterium group TaxID=227290 RepID=UPI0010475137|nr:MULTISPECIES: DUF3828 domain-containing protein [Rhizobium/Agrobacterium group]KAA0699430.1 DUF3828 domain-containing protein [Neorhizobium sp. P12A]TCR91026.1 uncharacterized protein DUF3828 [Rhizobium sp. BK376]